MFTKYIETFLNLVERFVSAYEVRNTILQQPASDTSNATETRSARTAGETAQNDTPAEDTAPRGRRERTRSAPAEPEQQEQEEQQDPPARGRRERTRSADTGSATDNAPASAGGRRERTRREPVQEKPEPPKDTPEQADDRAEVENLLRLAGDVDDCTAECKEYMAGKGWASGLDIPADDLIDVLNDLNDIIDKYFGK